MKITSSAFSQGQRIPQQYTCEGEDLSPPLQWDDIPAGTQSLALICDDPDAPVGIWVHWVIYNLPANTTELTEGIPVTATLAQGAKQGINDFKKHGYGGPCPPKGKPHRYYFKLYALDTELQLKTGATKQAVEAAMPGHILDSSELMGIYQRSE